jgi:tryptophan synthase alpha chain
MRRIEATFQGLREREERALVTFFMAGDPSLDVTERLIIEAAERGADVIEPPTR